MAGATAGTDWRALWKANVLTLANVLDAVRDCQPECRVVVPGSAAEYGEWGADEGPLDEGHELRPSSPYGVSKAWQSVLAQSYAVRGSHVIVGRIFNLSGPGVPGQYVLGAVAEQLREIAAGERTPAISVGDISAVRDFVDVDDACGALLTLALHGTPGGVYNVCSGLPCSVGDAVDDLMRLSGTGARVDSMSRVGDRGGISWSVGSNAKIADETGWRPGTPFELSLRRMLG
jgi:GDP-4-dehydro-6-deoxy-D-mannose reductase